MRSSLFLVFTLAATCFGGLTAALLIYSRGLRKRRSRRRERALKLEGSGAGDSARSKENWAVAYMEKLTRGLFAGASVSVAKSFGKTRSDRQGSGERLAQLLKQAGCSGKISGQAFVEASLRLALAGLAAGALMGAFVSWELTFLLGGLGLVAGASAPYRNLSSAKKARAVTAERHLSEMLEVTALGLRSGLTFDRSFEMYGAHFDNDFALACARAHRRWSLGVMTREEALAGLAGSYDCPQLARILDSVGRSLKLGTSFTEMLEEAAAQSRASYRAALEERVAKAPVKMMLPTGTLILPAMLLLVLGPILLELGGGF